MIFGSVYALFCIESGKFYVGQTTATVHRRWREHVSASKMRNPPCRLVERAIKKYGSRVFVISCLSRCSSKDELDRAEVSWIKELKSLSPNGYNLRSGGARGKFSAESRARVRDSLVGKKHTTERRRNVSAASRRRSVVCVDDGLVFSSTKEAAEHYGIFASNVTAVCRKLRRTVSGRRFVYLEEAKI